MTEKVSLILSTHTAREKEDRESSYEGYSGYCGIFGLFASGPCSFEIYQGIDLLQHRGQEYCGIATFEHGVHQITHHGTVLNSFTDQDVDKLPGNWGIGHVSLKERQPVKWHSLMGEIAVAFSRNVINADELILEMMQQGTAFWRGYNVEILSRIVLEKKDTVAGLTALAEKIKGAYSLVILSREGIYATRDVYGFRPWGPTFISINKDRLDAYSECETSGEVVQAQDRMLQLITRNTKTKDEPASLM